MVTLTKGEYGLLVAFLDAPQRPLSREHLLQATVHEDVFDRSIDVQILRLRRKLERDPSAPRVIQTERGLVTCLPFQLSTSEGPFGHRRLTRSRRPDSSVHDAGGDQSGRYKRTPFPIAEILPYCAGVIFRRVLVGRQALSEQPPINEP